MNTKELRQALGLSLEAMARELGVSLQTVHRWEKGKYRPSHLAQEKLNKLERRIK